jgi:ribonuclease J
MNEEVPVSLPEAYDDLVFLPLGGVGEIGMNVSLYGYGGRWLMVDLGITFAGESVPGVDLVLPDLSYIAERRDRLDALVLTHAHEDHLGAVAYLWPKLQCPVYATPYAAAILRTKLDEADLLDDVPLHEVDLGDSVTLGPFKVTYVRMTHSIPEPASLIIETDAGRIVHSGDWKLDPDPVIGDTADQAQLEKLGAEGVLALICDSTNAVTEGRSGSEGALRDSLSALIAGQSGRVAITTFASNVARLKTIARSAEDNGRRVCLVGRSLWRSAAAAETLGLLDDIPAFLTERDFGYLPDNKVLLLCTGCQGERRGAMSRIVTGQHPHVTLHEGDCVIFSSKIIPGNERELFALHNQLVEREITVITEKDAFVHVSGHPCRDELRDLYRWLKPRIAVPVHGEARHLMAHAELAEEEGVPDIFEIRNGDILRLGPGECDVIGDIETGALALDGSALVPMDGAVIHDRRKLLHNGAAFVTLVLDGEGACVEPPRISLLGLPAEDGGRAISQDIAARIIDEIGRLSRFAARDDQAVAEAARLALRRTVRSAYQKRPVTEVQVVRLGEHQTVRGSSEEKISV